MIDDLPYYNLLGKDPEIIKDVRGKLEKEICKYEQELHLPLPVGKPSLMIKVPLEDFYLVHKQLLFANDLVKQLEKRLQELEKPRPNTR